MTRPPPPRYNSILDALYEGFYLYIDDFIMDTGFESAELVMDHLDVSKEFYLSGKDLVCSGDSIRTYWTDWNISEASFQISNWEIEGHSERDEGAYFRGGSNAYHFDHITLNSDNWSNEQGMDFNDVDYSTFKFDSCDFSDFTYGLYVRSSNYCEFDLNEIEAHDNTSHALYFTGITYSDFDMSGLRCSHNGSRGVQIDGSYNSADMRYSIMHDNQSTGFCSNVDQQH